MLKTPWAFLLLLLVCSTATYAQKQSKSITTKHYKWNADKKDWDYDFTRVQTTDASGKILSEVKYRETKGSPPDTIWYVKKQEGLKHDGHTLSITQTFDAIENPGKAVRRLDSILYREDGSEMAVMSYTRSGNGWAYTSIRRGEDQRDPLGLIGATITTARMPNGSITTTRDSFRYNPRAQVVWSKNYKYADDYWDPESEKTYTLDSPGGQILAYSVNSYKDGRLRAQWRYDSIRWHDWNKRIKAYEVSSNSPDGKRWVPFQREERIQTSFGGYQLNLYRWASDISQWELYRSEWERYDDKYNLIEKGLKQPGQMGEPDRVSTELYKYTYDKKKRPAEYIMYKDTQDNPVSRVVFEY